MIVSILKLNHKSPLLGVKNAYPKEKTSQKTLFSCVFFLVLLSVFFFIVLFVFILFSSFLSISFPFFLYFLPPLFLFLFLCLPSSSFCFFCPFLSFCFLFFSFFLCFQVKEAEKEGEKQKREPRIEEQEDK